MRLILISEAHCLTISLRQQNRSDDHKMRVKRSILPPKDWVTGSILSSKTYSGWWIQFRHPESWVKISIRSPKLWVTVLILLPKLHSRRNNTTTLTRWLGGVLWLPGSVTLCRDSSSSKILLTIKTFIIPWFNKKRPQVVCPVWTNIYIAPRYNICKSSDSCGKLYSPWAGIIILQIN